MLIRWRWWLCGSLVVLLVAIVFLRGGGPKRTTVTGTISGKAVAAKLKEKLPYKGAASPVRIVFVPEDTETFKQDGPSQAVVKQDGSFRVPGPDGKGLRPGSYKVAIAVVAGGSDLLRGRYNESNSTIIRTVGETSENFEIDLDTGQ